MPLAFQVTYSERLVRRAVLAYWRRTIGPGYFAAMILVAICFAGLVWQRDQSWIVGVLATVLVTGLLFACTLYAVHLKRSLAMFQRMATPTATFVLDDSSITIESELGSSSLQWSAISEVCQFEEFWLLTIDHAQWFTLPLQDVPAAAEQLILTRVAACGGTIVRCA